MRTVSEKMRTVSGVWRIIRRKYAEELGVRGIPLGWRWTDLGIVDDVWVERSLDSRWTVAYRISRQYGALVVMEIRIFPTEQSEHRPPGEWSAQALGSKAKCPRGGITASGQVKKVRVREGLQYAARKLRDLDRWERDFFAVDEMVKAGKVVRRTGLIAELPPTPTPGRRRPRISDEELRRVAKAYRRAFRRDPRRVNIIVAKKLRLLPQRIRDLVFLARQREFLPPTRPGHAGI